MKGIHIIPIIAVFAAVTSMAAAQNYPEEYLGLPGDNLNLYAVMDLFQGSETLEAFERSLNDKDNTINNLDLNGDNFVDYITVSDYVDKNVHNIVLRTYLDRNEQQDIAVFVVEKLRDGAVEIQLIGDEALYGPNYIVEPIYAETPNPGYSGNIHARSANVYNTTYYEIAAWPLITYIYHPRYRVWRSAWYWDYYPSYWVAWRPHYWHFYYGYHSHWHNHYYSHYRPWKHYRCRSYNTYYINNVRIYSRTVYKNVDKGHYRNTYSRPNQRRAGEQYYVQTAGKRTGTRRTSVSTQHNGSRPGTISQRQATQRTTRVSTEARSRVSTDRQNSKAVRSTTTRSSNGQRSRPAVSKSNSQRSSAAVQSRSSQSRNSSSVRGSSEQRSRPAVSKSNNQRSSAAVQSRSVRSKSSSSVSRNNGQKSRPAVSKSSSKRSTSTVQSRSGSRKSSSSVSRSSSRKSSSSVSRSTNSSGRKSGNKTGKNR